MTWFKVDDSLAFHRKVVKAGNAAMGLWVRAGSWAAQQLTDGHVPDHMIAVLGTPAQARKLVTAGLWERVDDGYVFHDWTEDGRNPTRSEIVERRSKDTRRKTQYRGKKSEESQVSEGSHAGTDADVPAESQGDSKPPDPTRPDPGSPNGEPHGDRFDEFWQSYPRKTNKKAARTAWAKALRTFDADTLISEARRWAGLWDNAGVDRQYIPHPSTWLNGERWEDEPPAPRLRAVSGGHTPFQNPTDQSVYDEPLL